jgi:hypothetical protein
VEIRRRTDRHSHLHKPHRPAVPKPSAENKRTMARTTVPTGRRSPPSSGAPEGLRYGLNDGLLTRLRGSRSRSEGRA